MPIFSLTAETLLAFALASAIVELTPGPNMAYLAVLSISEGRRSGMSAVAGVALGLLLVGIAAALGMAALISASPVMYQGLRWGGVFYLLWLAWEAWRPERTEENEFAESNARYFRRGLVVNLLNPKAAVFYIAMLPQFVDTTQAPLTQTLTLSLLFVLIATAIHASIVILGGTAHGLLHSTARRRKIRRVMAVALVAIALWFLFETQ